jgi:hypothetical protein
MRDLSPNHYEWAFESWLIDNRLEYARIDEHEREALDGGTIKSFDFLVRAKDGRTVMVEVKGRRFRGTSFEKMTGLECWVPAEDIDGLTKWKEAFGSEHEAVFVFAYLIEQFDVDCDGRNVHESHLDRYVFLYVRLEDYRRFMKPRSPRWETVTLPAHKFRRCAGNIGDLLL